MNCVRYPHVVSLKVVYENEEWFCIILVVKQHKDIYVKFYVFFSFLGQLDSYPQMSALTYMYMYMNSFMVMDMHLLFPLQAQLVESAEVGDDLEQVEVLQKKFDDFQKVSDLWPLTSSCKYQ